MLYSVIEASARDPRGGSTAMVPRFGENIMHHLVVTLTITYLKVEAQLTPTPPRWSPLSRMRWTPGHPAVGQLSDRRPAYG